MPQKLSALLVGAKVKEANSLYFGKPIIFRVVDKNHAGYPANSVTLQTDKIIALKAFDGKEASNSDANRKNYGNNRYIHSNLRQWLNSDKAANAWYTAQHTADAPPTTANSANYNGYDTEAGFLAGFSASLKAALMETTLTVAKNTVTDGGGSETATDKIFLASNTEVGLTNENSVAEGSILAAYSDNTSRLAYPTAEAVANSNYTSSSFNTGAAWYWWLRTPTAANSYIVRNVYTSGTLNYYTAYHGHWGVRPLCNLSSEILVSDSVDSDGAYTIIWNQPPTAPNGITPPTTALGGKSATISWGASTDSDGSISGYIAERATNGGAFAQIYKGINRTYTDTITAGLTSVQYRVKAYDNNNAESAYTTASVQTVINSNPPTISGSNADLGAKTGAFSQTYNVTNPDSGITKTLTVVEKIDAKQKRSFTATSGATNTFSVTADEWRTITNGSHTLTITVTDNYGDTATRQYTFSKSETQIEFTLATPLSADAAVTKGIMNVSRQIPAGATFSVEVCNNGFDATPTWEDVTAAVIAGSKFFLTNTTKTATNWGFNIRIKADRQTAQGDLFIAGLGGNFE
ncbi:MAG: DUF6273 domain-containing protein [Oscillospiraceae bacterium]|jgi:hypothetical protein|nr:DUF6273 domain-containing protein [Oscillospiraceae bacterium]